MIAAMNSRDRRLPSWKSLPLLWASLFLGSTLWQSTPVAAESWTNLRGTNTIEAEMIGLWGDRLVLALEDGRRVVVALDELRAESRIQAQNLARSKEEQRAQRIKELQAQADVAAAPAPDPLPQPVPAEPYQRPQPTEDPAAFFQAMDDQLRAGHVVVVFDALPPSYQQELDELAKLAAVKINGLTWSSLINSIHQWGEVIVTRQNWFFTHPLLDVDATSNPEATQRLNDSILSLAGLIRVGLDPQQMDLNSIQDHPLREWLLQRNQAISPYVAEMYRRGTLSPPEFAVEKGRGKEVTLIMTRGETEDKVPLVKVENVWLPKSIADAWEGKTKEIRKTLEEAPDGSLMADPSSVMLLAVAAPLLDPLSQARNRHEFHAAMQTLIGMAMPVLESLPWIASKR